MPTFLIFRSGSVIETIQGANPPQLTSAVEKAAKLAGPAAAPTYSTAGRTLGASPTAGTSVYRRYNVQRILDAVLGFLGLYFTSLFSIDAFAAAENSPFNIHKPRAEPRARTTTTQGRPTTQSGKKLGTISDISGGN
jgi:thioredoxin 1